MKKFSPENNISLYIIGICLFLITVACVVVGYFRSVSEAISKQYDANQQYFEMTSLSEVFIKEALNSQELFNEYMFTWKQDYVVRYRSSVARMDSIIALTKGHEKLRKENKIFNQVKGLLDEQYRLIPKLKKRLYAENPVDKVAQDSLFTKNLYLAVGRASLSYDINIRSIRYEILNVLSLNNDISEKISKLLLDIYRNTSTRSIQSMDSALEVAYMNNRYSLLVSIGTIIMIVILSIIIFVNIYRIKKTKKDLENANREKEEIMDSRHRLLLSVTHDIKTPMSSIKAYLSSSDITVEERRIMLDSTSHVLSLMDNLLDFSTMQSGKIHVNARNFNLRDLCDASIDMFNSLAAKKGVALKKEYLCDCDIRVHSDDLKIKQILINLISNAFKYTVRGHVSVSVNVAPAEEGASYVLSVTIADTGVGIAPDQIPDMFKAYYRSDDNKHLSGGTGLGLYVVDGFTRLLGGDIKIESQKGVGTTVHVTLPLAKYVPNNTSDTSKRILVIEDDPVFRTVAKMLLSRLSHEVVTSSGIESGDFDYVLSDLNLGDISRMDVLKKYKDIPVVLMTADTSFPKEQALAEGFHGILYKPFSVDDVKDVFGGVPVENDSIVMLGDDTSEMNSVVETFMKSIPSYLDGLKMAVRENDIFKARHVSHKMLPMFVLFKSGDMIPILNKLNAVNENNASDYHDWKSDVESLIRMIHAQYI